MFKSLRQFAITPEKTIQHELTGLLCAGCTAAPLLTVRHAGAENPAYTIALAKLDTDLKGIGNSMSASAKRLRTLAQARLIAYGGCVTSWVNVRDDEAPTVNAACTPEKINELLMLLLDEGGGLEDVFWRLFNVINDTGNFRPAPAPDVESLGKP